MPERSKDIKKEPNPTFLVDLFPLCLRLFPLSIFPLFFLFLYFLFWFLTAAFQFFFLFPFPFSLSSFFLFFHFAPFYYYFPRFPTETSFSLSSSFVPNFIQEQSGLNSWDISLSCGRDFPSAKRAIIPRPRLSARPFHNLICIALLPFSLGLSVCLSVSLSGCFSLENQVFAFWDPLLHVCRG